MQHFNKSISPFVKIDQLMCSFHDKKYSIALQTIKERICVLLFLHSELAPDVQQDDDADERQAGDEDGGGTHLQAGAIVRIELQYVIGRATGSGTGPAGTGGIGTGTTSLRVRRTSGGARISRGAGGFSTLLSHGNRNEQDKEYITDR